MIHEGSRTKSTRTGIIGTCADTGTVTLVTVIYLIKGDHHHATDALEKSRSNKHRNNQCQPRTTRMAKATTAAPPPAASTYSCSIANFSVDVRAKQNRELRYGTVVESLRATQVTQGILQSMNVRGTV